MEIKSIDYENETITIETFIQRYITWSSIARGEDWGDEDYDLTINPYDIVERFFLRKTTKGLFIKEHYPKAYERSIYDCDFITSLAIINYFIKRNDSDIEETINNLAQIEYEHEKEN